MRQGVMAAYVALHAGTEGEGATSIFQSIFFCLQTLYHEKILMRKSL
jgi:hypothetical protein